MKTNIICGMVSDYEKVIACNAPMIIARKSLKRLESLGNLNARELLNGQNSVVCLDDLAQEVALCLWSEQGLWTWDDNANFIHICDDGIKVIYGCVSRYLYQFHSKFDYKRAWLLVVNNDGEEICVLDSVKGLASITDYDSIFNDDKMQRFYTMLLECKDVDGVRARRWLEYRLQGLSNSAIAPLIHKSVRSVEYLQKKVRKLWADFE